MGQLGNRKVNLLFKINVILLDMKNEFTTKSGLKILLRAMSSTSLRDSLNKIHLSSEAIQQKEAQKIFAFYKFGVKVKTNKKWPISMN